MPTDPVVEQHPAERKMVYLICLESDRKQIIPIYKYLRKHDLDVETPLFNGTPSQLREAERTLLMACDAVLLFYGDGDDNWRYSKDLAIKKASGYLRARPLRAYATYVHGASDEDKTCLLRMEPTAIDGLAGPEDHLLDAFVRQVSTVADRSLDVTDKPYPGLRPYRRRVAEAPCDQRRGEEHFFFGRDRHIDAMTAKMAETRFLAVLGVSGSGKSSLVTSGMLPALYGGYMTDAGSIWKVAYLRPQEDPIGNLARALGRAFGEEATDADAIEARLREGGDGQGPLLHLIDLYEKLHPSHGAAEAPRVNLLVIVDQFEELFPRNAWESAREDEKQHETKRQFVRLLLGVLQQWRYPVYVCLTLRSDFVGEAARYEDLPDAINGGLYLVSRMLPNEIEEAIKGPAAIAGAAFDREALDEFVRDVEDPAHLVVLQHALSRTWDRWMGEGGQGPILKQHYEAIGEIQHAIDWHAEEVYASLETDRQRALCAKVFRGLTGFTYDGRGIRYRTRLDDLWRIASVHSAEPDVDRRDILAIVDTFRRPEHSLLMPPSDVPLEGDTMVEISHESLMLGWIQLKRWMADEGADAQTYIDLVNKAIRYEKAPVEKPDDDPRDYLLGGNELTRARELEQRTGFVPEWTSRYRPEADEARRFLVTSSEEATRLKRRNRIVIYSTGALALALVVVIFIAQHRTAERDRAELETQVERMRSSALVSSYNALRLYKLSETDPALALAQAAYFLSTGSGGALQDNVHDALREIYNDATFDFVGLEPDPVPLPMSGQVRAVAFNDRWIAAGSDTNLVGIWPADEFATASTPTLLGDHTGPVRSVTFNPTNADQLASGSRDRTIRIWDLATRATVRVLQSPGEVWAVAYSPDGRWLASAGRRPEVLVWDLDRAGAAPSALPLPEIAGTGYAQANADTNWVNILAFGEIDGDPVLGAGSEDGKVRLWWNWQLAGGDPVVLRPDTDGRLEPINALAFSPSAPLVAAGGDDFSVRLWHIDREDRPDELGVLPGTAAVINALAFSPDGRWLASGDGGFEHTIMMWDLRQLAARGSASEIDRPYVFRRHQEWVYALAFGMDASGKLRLVSGGKDRTVQVWRTDPREMAEDLCRALKPKDPGNDLLPGLWEKYVSTQLAYDKNFDCPTL